MKTPKIEEIRKQAAQLGKLSQQDLVALGALLWKRGEEIQDLLLSVKEAIRSRSPRDPGQHLLESPGVTCQVTVPSSHVVLSSEADLDDIRRVLGSDFDRLFRTTESVNPSKDFEDAFQNLDPEKASALRPHLEVVQGKARISFRSKES